MPALAPPMFAITRPPSTSGEPAAPKNPSARRTLRRLVRPQPLAAFEAVRAAALQPRTCRQPRRDHRNRARPLVEAEVIAVGRRIAALPLRRPARRIERLDHRDRHPMKEDHAADHHRAAQALPDLPSRRRSDRRGKGVTIGAPHRRRYGRAQELGPVGGEPTTAVRRGIAAAIAKPQANIRGSISS